MISIVIPVYNSASTLKECLDAIFNSNFKNFEVIVVSDKSPDDSVNIAKKYSAKIIELDENKGPAFARNKGAEMAKGDIILFLDSDVIIETDSLNLIDDEFSSNNVDGIQGIYSHNPDYKYTATQFYQSYLCYYVWPKEKKYVSTLVTACFGIRKKIFNELNGFDTKMKNASCEDEKFGYELIKNGFKIVILRNVQVIHRVNYNILKFIKRRFIQDVDRIRFYLREKTYTNKIKQKNYSKVIIGIFILGLILLTALSLFFFNSAIIWYFLIMLNLIYIFLHFNFLKFASNTKGPGKIVSFLMMFYLDTFLMILATSYGFLSFFLLKKRY